MTYAVLNDLDARRAMAVIANAMPREASSYPATTAHELLKALDRAGFKLVRDEVLSALRDRAKANPDG